MNNITRIVTITTALFILPAINAQAADTQAGKEKAAKCASCHGKDGISNSPLIPNLAGQKEAYLVKALEAYKEGQRSNAMMRSVTASLNEEDMADLAAYYSSLSP
jgi:cytochrome c553